MRSSRAVLALLLCAAGACTTAPPPPPPPAPLSVQVVQYRRDVERDVVQVRLTSARPLRVQAVQLRTTTFASRPPKEVDDTVGPGRALALPVPLGVARCPAPDAAPPRVRLRVEGVTREVTVLDAASRALLQRVHARSCTLREVQATLALRFLPGWAPDTDERGRPALRAALELRRRAGRVPVRLLDLGGNTLLTVRAVPPRNPVAVLAPDAMLALVQVRVTATRCDPHALAESKQTATFVPLVQVGDATPVVLPVRVTGADRRTLEDYAVRTCTRAG